jgi:hypothetical protein
MPRPELRTNFTIPHLDRWIKEPDNQRCLLRHLLVLVMDWIAAGAARSEHTMRQFTTWAAAAGGFLAHHGVTGFLDNVEEVRALDEDDNDWAVFLARWFKLYGAMPQKAGDIRKSADPEGGFGGAPLLDRWEGDFITGEDGRIPNAKSLGRMLAGQVGRFHGQFVLRQARSRVSNVKLWTVEEHGK